MPDSVPAKPVGLGPFNVDFTDTSSNTPTSWAWNFGDSTTSIFQNPSHIYASVATQTTYTVRLIASNAFGSSTAMEYITVSPIPVHTGLPSLKLFTGQSLPQAFDIANFLPSGSAATYSVVANFLGLSSLLGSYR